MLSCVQLHEGSFCSVGESRRFLNEREFFISRPGLFFFSISVFVPPDGAVIITRGSRFEAFSFFPTEQFQGCLKFTYARLVDGRLLASVSLPAFVGTCGDFFWRFTNPFAINHDIRQKRLFSDPRCAMND